MGRITSSGCAGNIGSHKTKSSVIRSFLAQPRDMIRPIRSSYLSNDVFIIYLHKNNNKHFHFSDKHNKYLKLIPCDVTFQHRSAKFLMTSHCSAEQENEFIVSNSFSLMRKK